MLSTLSLDGKNSKVASAFAYALIILVLFLLLGTSLVPAHTPMNSTSQTPQGAQFNPGESFTVSVTCTNTGQNPLPDVVIRTNDPWIDAGEREHDLGSLQVGESKSTEITGKVPTDASQGASHHITFECYAPSAGLLSSFSMDLSVATQQQSSSVSVPPNLIPIGAGIAGVAGVAAVLEWIRRHHGTSVPGEVLADPAPVIPGRVLADPAPVIPGRVLADPAPVIPGRVLAEPATMIPARIINPPPPGQMWTPPGNVNTINANPVNQNAVNVNPVNVNQNPVNVNVNVTQPPPPVVTSQTPAVNASGTGPSNIVGEAAVGAVAGGAGIGAMAFLTGRGQKCVWCASKIRKDDVVCSHCGVHQRCTRCGTMLYKAFHVSKGYQANPQDQGLFCDRCNTFTT